VHVADRALQKKLLNEKNSRSAALSRTSPERFRRDTGQPTGQSWKKMNKEQLLSAEGPRAASAERKKASGYLVRVEQALGPAVKPFTLSGFS
jgi:hypothetical protein